MSCFQFLFSLQSLKTVQANGLVRPGLTMFVYECSHCTNVSMHCMCLCVSCIYILCVCCLSCSIQGLWNISGGRWGCVCVPTTVLRSGRARRRSSQWHLRAGWLAGWLATANCICTINDKVPLCVMVLGGGSWRLPTKSNSLIW